MTRADRLERFEAADLYVVITDEFCAGRPAVDVLQATLDAGVRLVQLREKNLTDRELYDRAVEFRRRTSEADAVLIIDDRVDIALAANADGVHLGQTDLPLQAAVSIAPELILGVSTHTREQAVAAQAAGAGYVNIGPIFATQTKQKTAPPLGPEALDDITPGLTIPFSCMGGIKPHNIDEVLRRGAKHPAVVTAVTAQDDVKAAATALRQKILAAPSPAN